MNITIWPACPHAWTSRTVRCWTSRSEADEDRGNVETFESDKDDVDVEWSKRCPALEGLCKGLGPLVGFLVVERKMLTLTPSPLPSPMASPKAIHPHVRDPTEPSHSTQQRVPTPTHPIPTPSRHSTKIKQQQILSNSPPPTDVSPPPPPTASISPVPMTTSKSKHNQSPSQAINTSPKP